MGNFNNQSNVSLQYLIATGLGHQKVLKNIQSPPVISYLLYKNITMVIHRFTDLTVERKTYLQQSTQRENGKKWFGNKRLEEKVSSAERVPRQSLSNSCFEVSKWRPLNLYQLSCKDQTNLSVKEEHNDR